jgi:hypothetical protein
VVYGPLHYSACFCKARASCDKQNPRLLPVAMRDVRARVAIAFALDHLFGERGYNLAAMFELD